MKERYSEEQIIGAIKRLEAGAKVSDLSASPSAPSTTGEVSTGASRSTRRSGSGSSNQRMESSSGFWRKSCLR